MDLIDRLHYAHTHSQQRVAGSGIFKEAADEIERLRSDYDALWAERERLRMALLESHPYVPEHHGPVQARVREALGPINQQTEQLNP
jgi:hypothetical protein